jgi:hypothetical protein
VPSRVLLRIGLLGVAALAVQALVPVPAAAQNQRFALIVEGASGEPQYAALHRGWVDSLTGLLRDRFKFEPDKLVVLAEKPAEGEQRSTAENVRTVLGTLAKQVQAGDLLFVMLIGHGSGQGAEAKFNLIGPDLSAAEWGALFEPIAGRIAVVNATSSSFAYLEGLSAPDRVVITATSTYAQRFHTRFAEAFIAALGAGEADLDKNGRISLLEAFSHASRLVDQHFEQTGLMQTERAMIEDTGDATGRDAASEGEDGELAARTYLDGGAAVAIASASPELQPLLARQAELTAEVEDLLRRRRLLPPDFYQSEFERLMIELSLVSRDVRRRTGGS